ncbi:MAG TPA: flagellar basal body-associated FliL family protein [Acidobacteriota bacterium]|nr:flagellar basal body-associated FliL family protein [Acidobacteriota bacterium]
MVDEADDFQAAETEEASERAAGKKGGGLIKIVIVLVVIVVAVVAGWFVAQMILPPPAADGEQPAAVVEKVSKPLGDLYDPENPPGVLEFADPFLIRLRKPPGLMQNEVYLKVSLTLEVGSEEIREEMQANEAVMSRISDTIITFMASKFPEEIETPVWTKLKDDLLKMINNQFPEAYYVRRVNFREFVVQSR